MANCCTLQNSRQDACPSVMDIAKRLILVPEVNASGAVNKFATAGDVIKATLQGKFDAADKYDRFYPIDVLENVEDIRADAEFFEFNSGKKAKIKDGTRTFTGFIPFQAGEYMGKLEDWSCNKFGVYIIDKAGNFVYATDESTKLEVLPIMVDEASFSVELMKKTDAEPVMIKITFDFRESEKDALLRLIKESDLDFDGLSEVDVYGLYDAKHVVSDISTTGFTSTISEAFYGFAIENLVPADFSLYNETTSAPVTITAAPETSEGVYEFTFAAQTVADVLKLSLSKSGYDDSLIEAATITIA